MLCVALLVANFAAVAAAAGQSVNYCGAKMCSHTDAHTFCQYPPGPSPKCVGYIDAQLSSEEKVRLMARLNRRRSEAASGRLQHLPTAGNMLKLRWVEELAREAQRWADQCRPPKTPEERDTCRDLFSVSVGQCVASVVGEAPGLRVESLVDMWYMQSLHFKENITAYVVPVSNVNFYGDFAQMIWAWSYMVGCGRSRFMAEVNGRLRSVERLVCNFAPRGPSAGRALWAPGAPAASCPPRSAPDPALPALCNFRADLDVSTDVDGVLTIEEHVLLSTVLEVESKESLNYLGSLDELYLTKLAIVTMDNYVTQALPHENIVYKRNIIQTLHSDDKEVDLVIKFIDDENKKNINTTLYTKESPNVAQHISYKDIKTVGRPKPYNMEELIDVIAEQNISEEINHHETTERDFPKIDRDVYLEYYENSAVAEVNISYQHTTDNTNKSNDNVSKFLNEVNTDSKLDTTKVELAQNVSIEKELSEENAPRLDGDVSTLLNNIALAETNDSLATKADVEYLTD
ncbi:hypothetical protein evm_002032, partial [Chilo suppressalis]